jgi:Ca2+-binding EF-hand superfamily protein
MPRIRPVPTALALCGFLTICLTPQIASADTSAAVVSRYDKDNDRTLDLAEVKAAASARFNRLNKDADNTLDIREIEGVIGKNTFAAADTDHDGTLSRDEYLALVQKLFEQADTNHDGKLSAKELSSKTGRMLKRLID